jgi:hypothetical protein
VVDVVAVDEIPNDLSVVVDARSYGAIRAEGIVERGVGAVAVEEAVGDVVAIDEKPDDLSVVVDVQSCGAKRAVGIVERGVGAVAVEKAMRARAQVVIVSPNDLAVVVDAPGYGAIRAEGIVERGVGSHFAILSCNRSCGWKTAVGCDAARIHAQHCPCHARNSISERGLISFTEPADDTALQNSQRRER